MEYRTKAFSIVAAQGDSVVLRETVPTDLEGEDLTSWSYELLDEGAYFLFLTVWLTEIDTQQQSGWTSESKTNLIPAVRLSPPTCPACSNCVAYTNTNRSWGRGSGACYRVHIIHR